MDYTQVLLSSCGISTSEGCLVEVVEICVRTIFGSGFGKSEGRTGEHNVTDELCSTEPLGGPGGRIDKIGDRVEL